MKERERDEYIDQYILNKLSEEERIAFEEEMRNDKDLEESVMLRMHIAVAFQRKTEAPVLEALNNIESEGKLRAILSKAEDEFQETETQDGRRKNPLERSYEPSHSANKRPILPYIAAAAVVIALVWFGIQPKYSSGNLYADYYSAEYYEPLPSRGDELSADEKSLYEAVRLMESDTERALILLQSLQTDDTFLLKEDAQWNIALAYLKLEKRSKAKTSLKEIIAGKGEYAEKAGELLNRLNEKKWF